jgi:hypothetical protein
MWLWLWLWLWLDRLCGLVVRVPGYRTEMYCASCEVRTEFIYVMYVQESTPPLWSGGQNSWLLRGDVLFFLWITNWIYICYVEESRQPMWSPGQSSWQQIRSSGFHFGRYQIFWDGVCLQRGPLNLVSTKEELLGRNKAAPAQKAENTAVWIRHADHVAPSVRRIWY